MLHADLRMEHHVLHESDVDIDALSGPWQYEQQSLYALLSCISTFDRSSAGDRQF